MLETKYSVFFVNIMPADALAPKVTRASTDMILTVRVYGRQQVRVL